MHEITSHSNPSVKRLKALLSRAAERGEAGLFVVESRKIAVELVQKGFDLREIYLTKAAANEDRGMFLQNVSPDVCLITEEIAQKVSSSPSSQGVFGVFAIPLKQPDPPLLPKGRYIACEEMQDPGNAGAIIRSACALGLDGILFVGSAPDRFSPKVIRASAGMSPTAPVFCYSGVEMLADASKRAGIALVGAALHERAVSLEQLSLPEGGVILIGNEGNGLSRRAVSACDILAVIPMMPGCESLNAAAAASIFIWELSKRSPSERGI